MWPIEKNMYEMNLKSIVAVLVALFAWNAMAEVDNFKSKFLLILFDGFRWNYLNRVDLPNFDRFQTRGVRAEYMQPTFPSLSYPGYYTIMTGLFVENHGFIDNNMYDPIRKMSFHTDTDDNGTKAFWWEGAEPLWITSTKAGLRTYVYQWPGCHVHMFGTVPTYYEKYEYHTDTRVLRRNIADILNRFETDEADVGIVYSEYTDIVGHTSGPESDEMAVALRNIDSVVGLLLDGLDEKSLDDKVNIIILSDHGMTSSDVDTVQRYQLDNLTNLDDIELILGFGATAGIKPVPGKLEEVYSDLKMVQGLNVWKKEEIPERLHYKNNERVPPILVVAEKGFFIEQIENTAKQIPSPKNGIRKYYKGFHGYDSAGFPDMRAIFLAMGPDFVPNLLSSKIQMTDVYNLMTYLVKADGHENNGTWNNIEGMLRNFQNTDTNMTTSGMINSLVSKTSIFLIALNLLIINLSAILALMGDCM